MKSSRVLAVLLMIAGMMLSALFLSCGKSDEPTAPQNQAPAAPTLNTPGGAPPHGSTNQSITPKLAWNCSDPENDSLFYDVYLGTDSAAMAKVSSGQTATYYEPAALEYGTTYFWKVVAKDKPGNSASSPTWQFTTQSAPGLVLSETALNFGTAQTTLTFNITNSGAAELTWTISANQAWVSVNPASGATTSETDQITVTVNRGGLDPGPYSATITVTSNVGDGTVQVSMEVPTNPTLSVTPASLDFGTAGTDLTFDIANTGTGELTWNIAANEAWVTVDPASGSTTTETDQITVTVDRSTLPAGAYTDTLAISSNGGNGKVAVSMEVLADPVLDVSTNQLDFGSEVDNLHFEIANIGGSELFWTITTDQAWITVNPTSGSTTTESDPITVSVNRIGLLCGDYSGNIIVDAGAQTETIEVFMQVTGLPAPNVTPSSLDFPVGVNTRTLSITNAKPECGTLTWSISSPESWLSFNPSSGSTDDETDEVIVTVNRSGLCTGSYDGSITVTTNGGDAGATVSMAVTAPAMSGSFSASATCGNAPFKVTFTASISGGVPPYTVSWDFGDGSTGSGTSVSHTFSSVGMYTVFASAMDKCGTSIPLGVKSITVVTAGYVILGQDASFTTYNYHNASRGGYGSYTVRSTSTGNRCDAYAHANGEFFNHSDGHAAGYIGREFTTGDCGGVPFQMGNVNFKIWINGELRQIAGGSGHGYSYILIDVYLFDITADSLVMTSKALEIKKTGGTTPITGNTWGYLSNVKIETGHLYRAYARLYVSAYANADPFTDYQYRSDFETDPQGMILEAIFIDF